MILIDTSILIDFFKGTNNQYTSKFENIINNNIPYGITYYSYQELLQGSKTEKEFSLLNNYLITQQFYDVLYEIESFEHAAKIIFKCRRKGITIRSTIDLLIAQIAIENNLYLFHNDSDFDNISKVIKQLKIY